jgi:hypothetical protein
MADALDSLGNPAAVTLHDIITHAGTPRFGEWLGDRKNSRRIPHRLEVCGYTPIRSRHTKYGHWVIKGRGTGDLCKIGNVGTSTFRRRDPPLWRGPSVNSVIPHPLYYWLYFVSHR